MILSKQEQKAVPLRPLLNTMFEMPADAVLILQPANSPSILRCLRTLPQIHTHLCSNEREEGQLEAART